MIGAAAVAAGLLVSAGQAGAGSSVLTLSPTTSSGTFGYGMVDALAGQTATKTFTLSNSGGSAGAITVTLANTPGTAFAITSNGCNGVKSGVEEVVQCHGQVRAGHER
jgi:hypothetical protein